MSPKQKKLYRELAEEMIGRLDNGDVVMATNPLTQTARLNQAAASFLDKRDCERCGATGQKPGSHEAAPHPDPAYADKYCYCAVALDDPMHATRCTSCGGRGHLYVPVAPSNKIDDLLNLLDELPKTEQVVVFAVSRKLIELVADVLAQHHVTCTLITGAVPEQVRYDHVDEFRAGQHRVCLVVIDAGGEGLDGLQVAQVGVFLQRHYSRLKNSQAEGRLLRQGQEGQVVFVDIRSEGTIEDDKEVILAQKEGRFEELVRDADTLRRLLALRP
jgi:SNF2 family DNA or RNA helicase